MPSSEILMIVFRTLFNTLNSKDLGKWYWIIVANANDMSGQYVEAMYVL